LFFLLFLIGCSENNVAPSSEKSKTSIKKVQSNSYIPIVLVLYEHSAYGGIRRYYIEAENDLYYHDFNFSDKATSAIVYKGPDYDAYKAETGTEPTVTLYSDGSFGGSKMVLRVGKYTDFSVYGFNDVVSSIQFLQDANPLTPNDQPDNTFSNIHTVIKLFQDAGQSGYRITVLGTTNLDHKDISDYTPIFNMNDRFTSFIASRGPNSTSTSGVRFYTGSYTGSNFTVYSGDGYGAFPNTVDDLISSHQSLP
jgi:hypothetical protein